MRYLRTAEQLGIKKGDVMTLNGRKVIVTETSVPCMICGVEYMPVEKRHKWDIGGYINASSLERIPENATV